MRRMSGVRKSPGVWALALGVVGGAAGFFGPMILNPDANQGPMLGLFITGPGGALAGLVLGFIFRILPFTDSVRGQALVLFCTLFGAGILWFSLPEPVAVVNVVDGSIGRCYSPAKLMPDAIARWEGEVARYPNSPQRANWREDTARMVRESPGVIVEIEIERRNFIVENRKPWNRGKLDARGWRAAHETGKYFGGGACDSYPAGRHVQLALKGTGSAGWPPEGLSSFLGILDLEPVPPQYSKLLN